MGVRRFLDRIEQWFNTRIGWVSECYNCGIIVAPYRGHDVMCCPCCEEAYRYQEWLDIELQAKWRDKVGL